MKSVYAQNATVPIMIVLEEPSGTALPTPVVNRTDLAVKLGGPGKTFTVSLSSEPLEETTVSWGLNDDDLPLGGERDDLDMSLESFIFTSENWDEGQPVTVSANTDAETEEYLITFEVTGNIGGGGVGNTLPEVTVTVEDWLEINFYPRSAYERGIYVLIPVWLTVEEGFTVRVRVTLSLLNNSPDFLSVPPDRATQTFAQYNYEDWQDFKVDIGPNGVIGRYQVILTASRVGYNDIQKKAFFEIIQNPCQLTVRIMEGEVDFGTWNRPEEDGSEGSVTINSTTGLSNGGINMASVGEEPTPAKFELTTANCRVCLYGIRSVISGLTDDKLTRQNGGQTIDFNPEWSRWRDDILSRDRVGPQINIDPDPDGFIHTFQIGGTISGISGDESVTPAGRYQGRIGVRISCGP